VKVGAEGPTDVGAAIEALRVRGAARADPVRFHFIAALARRAAAHRGPTRRLLDAKLEQLLMVCSEAVDRAASAVARPRERAPSGDTLAELLAHIASHAAGSLEGARTGEETSCPTELKTVSYFRGTWSRLIVDRRMTQSQAAVAENAGPLNTQRLLHQALTAMRDASPEYLHRFMSHVEALLWLEHAGPPSAAEKKEPARATRTRKPAGTRTG
jgi:hypothetical protein